MEDYPALQVGFGVFIFLCPIAMCYFFSLFATTFTVRFVREEEGGPVEVVFAQNSDLFKKEERFEYCPEQQPELVPQRVHSNTYYIFNIPRVGAEPLRTFGFNSQERAEEELKRVQVFLDELEPGECLLRGSESGRPVLMKIGVGIGLFAVAAYIAEIYGIIN